MGLGGPSSGVRPTRLFGARTSCVPNPISGVASDLLHRNLHALRFMAKSNGPRELNLQTHRAPESVWDRRGWDGSREQIAMTRLLLGVGGAALAVQGIRQGSWTGRALAGMGGTLAWWALTGEGDLSEARGWFMRVIARA